ncbi:hypothetical protein Tco_1327845 [Tanacetum coccineum]
MWHWLMSTWHLKKLKRWWMDKRILLMIVQSLGMMNQIFPCTRIEPRSDKESLEVEIAKEKEVEISKEKEVELTNVVIPEHGNIQAQIKTHIDNAIPNVIPSHVDASVRSYISGHILHVHLAQSQTSLVPEQQYQLPSIVRPRDQDDPHDDTHPEGENSANTQKTSEYEAYVSGESSSGQVFQEEQAPSTSGNQEQNDDFRVIKSLTILKKAKLRKMADGCEKRDYITEMSINPEAPALSLINQDLLYLKKGNSGAEKIVLSLHKFPAIIFNDDDIEE